MSKRSINIEIKPRYRDEPFERVVRRFMKKAKKEIEQLKKDMSLMEEGLQT